MHVSGYSVIACRGVRKVVWNIEADVSDGYLLFITGDPISLGSWELEKAIHLSRCKEHANFFISEIKVMWCFDKWFLIPSFIILYYHS